MPPALSTFAIAADELRRQELARLADALTPRIEALRLMTPSAFRAVIALMMERLGHTIITDPSAPDLVTTKGERKFVIACARPTDLAPTGTRDLARLHDAVIATNAQRGIYVTARTFTAQAEQFSKTAPIDLVNGTRLIKALDHSLSGVLLPPTYKAMCRQCGAIVEHRIDRNQVEARPCGNGHLVPPTIARAMLVPSRAAARVATKPSMRPISRQDVDPHDYPAKAQLKQK